MKELIPYVGLIALALSVINTIYQRQKDKQQDWSKQIAEAVKPFSGLSDKIEGLTSKLEAVANRLLVLETKSEIFFKGVSFSSAQALHSPHTPELDALLEKFQRDELKDEHELRRLKVMLNDIVKSDPSSLRKKFALDILTLIRVRFEIGSDLLLSLSERDRNLQESMDHFSRRLKG